MPRVSGARHHVVIVGSGFGGLFAAKSLGRTPDTIEVTLIDRTNHHLFQPLLYQVATGILSEGQIAPPTRDVLKKKTNISVELAEVIGFDLKARHVTAVQPGGRQVTLSYDSLIVAAGVGQSYFGHDEYAEWAPGMKTLADALAHRARIFGAFEMAELESDADDSSGVALVRRRRRRPHRRRDRRPDRRTVEASTQAQFPAARLGRSASAPVRGPSGDPGHLRRQALRESDPRAGEDRGRDPRALARHPPGRARSRCQRARRVGPALLGEDEDLGRRCDSLASSENADGRNRRGMRPFRSHQGGTRLLITQATRRCS